MFSIYDHFKSAYFVCLFLSRAFQALPSTALIFHIALLDGNLSVL